MQHPNDAFVAIFDIETQEAIRSVPGATRDEKVTRLQVSCASVLCLPSEFVLDPAQAERAIELGTMQTFWRDGDTHRDMRALVRLLDKAEMIVGFNLVGFDWIVMKKYYHNRPLYERHRAKTHDVFSRVRDATGVWYKLDRLLALNGLGMKTADGLEAIRMWEEGRRDELQDYCESDVRQCARLALRGTLDVDAADGMPLDNHNFGIAAALTALRFAVALPLGEEAGGDDDGVRLVASVDGGEGEGVTAQCRPVSAC